MLIALVAIMVFFQFYTGGVLFRPVNLTNLVLQNSFIVIMALGMLLVIVAGHIDLSVGSIVAFVGAIAAILTVQLQMNYVLAVVILCLIIGGAYRRRPGLLDRLSADPVLHRDARRHAGVPRPDAVWCSAARTSVRSRRISRSSAPASCPTFLFDIGAASSASTSI